MSKLTRDDVLRLAHLSRLSLSDEEVERFRGELSEVLDYVEQLNSVKTDDLQPTYQVTGLMSVMRDDTTEDYGYKTNDLLKNAPSVQDKHFKVKRIL